MLADPAFCELAHTIGLASLGADEKTIWHLTKIYWYTVEFGVVREEGEIRAFGAGVLSSFGELDHMRTGADSDRVILLRCLNTRTGWLIWGLLV